MSTPPPDSTELPASTPAPTAVAPPDSAFYYSERPLPPAARSLWVPLKPLGTCHVEPGFCAQVKHAGVFEDIHHCADGRRLTGELRIDAAGSEDIETAAFEAYARLRRFIAQSSYPHLLRVWNFFDQINLGEGDAERYRRFCTGRHRAIAAPGFETRLPAATVIGSHVPGLVINFLASRVPGIQVENPRQTSAFLYPRAYGPVSPSFSRATLIGTKLLVSGTASVVGHQTQHPYDVRGQCVEIAANLRALLDHAARLHLDNRDGRWTASRLRVYLRHQADHGPVSRRLNLLPGVDKAPVAWLVGDICRADLMLEVEGVWTFQPA